MSPENSITHKLTSKTPMCDGCFARVLRPEDKKYCRVCAPLRMSGKFNDPARSRTNTRKYYVIAGIVFLAALVLAWARQGRI